MVSYKNQKFFGRGYVFVTYSRGHWQSFVRELKAWFQVPKIFNVGQGRENKYKFDLCQLVCGSESNN